MHPCPAGHMCNADVNYLSLPRPCHAGYYCTGGNSEQGCPTGTYSLYDATNGISSCTPVPPGYGFTAADHPPIRCAPGFYQDEYYNSNGCQPCSIGYECPGDNDSVIMRRCARGKFAPIQGLSTCFDCPEGFYCDSTTYDWPQPCAAGTYSDAGQYECTACPAGMDCIGQKKSTLTTCADGMYSMVSDAYCT
jgi:hypothetical protein